jgi:hypothetical protein
MSYLVNVRYSEEGVKLTKTPARNASNRPKINRFKQTDFKFIEKCDITTKEDQEACLKRLC